MAFCWGMGPTPSSTGRQASTSGLQKWLSRHNNTNTFSSESLRHFHPRDLIPRPPSPYHWEVLRGGQDQATEFTLAVYGHDRPFETGTWELQETECGPPRRHLSVPVLDSGDGREVIHCLLWGAICSQPGVEWSPPGFCVPHLEKTP